jgi:hypothetical protein
MEKIKLDNFSNEYPWRDFPEYASLSKSEVAPFSRTRLCVSEIPDSHKCG